MAALKRFRNTPFAISSLFSAGQSGKHSSRLRSVTFLLFGMAYHATAASQLATLVLEDCFQLEVDFIMAIAHREKKRFKADFFFAIFKFFEIFFC